jgi:tyrosine-protein kinase Etk/Wzc
MTANTDSVDLRELGSGVRQGWRFILGGVVAGLALAILVLLTVRPRYEATGTVLLRSPQSAPGALMDAGESSGGGESALGGLAEMFSLDSGFDTEMEILGSRAVAGAVVDSLGLQARVLEPWSMAPSRVLASARYPRDFEEQEFEFRREGDRYRVRGDGVATTVVPGEPFELEGAQLTLRASGMPESFTLEITDHQSAVTRTLRALGVDRAGGNVAELDYRDIDPLTAAAVPNAIIDVYMLRRKTTDRSINQRRYEFLADHTDSIAAQLAVASDALRRHQEQSGVLAPEVRAEAEVEQGMALLARRRELEVDARALAQVLEAGSRGALDARAVASYPTLIQNGAVNQLLARLSDLEARRTELLDRRTEEDPDVRLLALEIRQTQERILEIARSFQAGVTRQLAEVQRELARSQGQLTSLPAQVERSFQLERDVERLSETLVALQTQLVQARIAAMAEGGDIRQIDVAETPRKPLFPRRSITLALGMFGGLFFGLVAAVGSATIGRRIHSAVQLERITGLPVIALKHGSPLLLGGLDSARSMLVVASGKDASAGEAARHLAATATLRGRTVVLADLEDAHFLPEDLPGPAGTAVVHQPVPDALESVREPLGGSYQLFRANGNVHAGVRPLLADLEDRSSLVVVALPTVDHGITAALVDRERPVALVARAGRTLRSDLETSIEAFQRLGVQVAGIILTGEKEPKAP